MKTFGIERERFIMNSLGQIVPKIGILLPAVHKLAGENSLPESLFTHELFAGQIEDRTLPCRNLKELRSALITNDQIMSDVASQLGLTFDYSEFMETSRITALEVNPFDSRHQEIWQAISPERKIAASIVAAVHVHISADEDEAVKLINFCRENVIDALIAIGDHSNRMRINAYRSMAETTGVPQVFASFADIMSYINAKGGEKNVWDLVRYKPSTKTIEFRMFGATSNVDEVLEYVKVCLNLFEI